MCQWPVTHCRPKTSGSLPSLVYHNLGWVFYDHTNLALLIWLPLAVLLILYFRQDFPAPGAAEFLLGLGLWGLLQSAALGYGRANYGDNFPVSRYLDIINMYVIASVFALLLVVDRGLVKWIPGKVALLVPVMFAGVIFFGLGRISSIVVDDLLLPTRMMNLVAEERVAAFTATGDRQVLFEQPTVRPDPRVALGVLTDTNLQKILPGGLPAASLRAAYRTFLISITRVAAPFDRDFILRNFFYSSV